MTNIALHKLFAFSFLLAAVCAGAALALHLADARAERAAAQSAMPDDALSMARAAVEARGPNVTRLHTLTYAATVANDGQPDAEALRALLDSYALQRFASPREMAWRGGFAAAHWSAMPDAIQDLTLEQIAVLAEIGDTWDRRRSWCETFPDGALADAACASVPGVKRANS